jgi:hypothetical protein
MNANNLKVAIDGTLQAAGLACLLVVEAKEGYDIVLQLRRDVSILEARTAVDKLRLVVGKSAPVCFTVVQGKKNFKITKTSPDEEKQNSADKHARTEYPFAAHR